MNGPAKTFEDLVVWQKAHEMVLGVYEASRLFLKEEIFGLTSQLRRAASSVPTNIVEGFKRKGVADKLKSYNCSESSLEETRYHLILAHDLEYHDTSRLQNLCKEVGRILTSYIRTIRTQ